MAGIHACVRSSPHSGRQAKCVFYAEAAFAAMSAQPSRAA